jgi:hypothetical protein
MGRYVNSSDLFTRYPELIRVNSTTAVESAYVLYAENELDGLMASHFTVPFSSNNLTARDLANDFTYLKANNFKAEDRERFRTELYERVQRLKDGAERMVLSDSTTLESVGETIYSTTQDYHPVFGLDRTESFVVDSSQIVNERSDRGDPWPY